MEKISDDAKKLASESLRLVKDAGMEIGIGLDIGILTDNTQELLKKNHPKMQFSGDWYEDDY